MYQRWDLLKQGYSEVKSLVDSSVYEHTILHFIYGYILFIFIYWAAFHNIITYKLLRYVLVSAATLVWFKNLKQPHKMPPRRLLKSTTSSSSYCRRVGRTNNKCSCPHIFFSFSSLVLTPPFIPTLKMRRDCCFYAFF